MKYREIKIVHDGSGFSVVGLNENGRWCKLVRGFRTAEVAVTFVRVLKKRCMVG